MSLQENVPFGTPLANLNMEVKDLDTAPNAVFEVNLGQISSHVFMIPESTKLGNALAWVQRVHKSKDLWDITFCTRKF